MKQIILPVFLAIVLNLIGTKALAAGFYDFAVKNSDGVTIYYNYINEGKELSVTYEERDKKSYSGIVVIPEEVTFMNRTRKVTSIGARAFSKCNDLTSVTIPSSVTSIGKLAFYGCSSLSAIKFPDGITEIGMEAFENCTNLKSLELPKNLTIIDFGTFYGCKALKSIIIPNKVTSIKNKAFGYCSGLTSITIPRYVVKIEDEAFLGCDFTEVISNNENPQEIGFESFSRNTFYNATLYVPEGSIDNYKATPGWNNFSFIEEG